MAACFLFEEGMRGGEAKCSTQENSEQEKERVECV